jgi:hypothetical protein
VVRGTEYFSALLVLIAGDHHDLQVAGGLSPETSSSGPNLASSNCLGTVSVHILWRAYRTIDRVLPDRHRELAERQPELRLHNAVPLLAA